jgi:HD-GYP domain-containing protein (c-di-GMP phosphodiesterase class II)
MLTGWAQRALSEEGAGFSVTASYGAVTLPTEAATPEAALRLADERMYTHKHSSRSSARSQAQEVLMEVLHQRKPELDDHVTKVGELAAAVARRFTDDPETLDVIRRAAELHDIGKMAVPDAILEKPGPLTDEEWAFMRDHAAIGERILASAPALEPVAELVRASHESWDGSGYPDGLRGEEIPFGARVIAVCDAFNAMTSERPYSQAIPVSAALKELRVCAESQFDPRVVEAACEELPALHLVSFSRPQAAAAAS